MLSLFKYTKYCIAFLFCIIFSFSAEAQFSKKKIDSLYLVVRDMTDADSSERMIEHLLKETKANNYTDGTLKLSLLKGVNLYNSGKFDKALRFIEEIQPEAHSFNDPAKLSHLFAIKANCYLNLFYFEKSKECLNVAKQYAEKIKDNDARYSNLGRYYRLWANIIENKSSNNANIDSIMFYHKKSYYVHSKVKDIKYRGPLVIESAAIGNIFLKQNKLDSAMYYFLMSKKLSNQLKLDKFSIEALVGIGKIYSKKNNADSAFYYFDKALSLAIKAKRIGNIKIINKLLADHYVQIGDEEKAKYHLDIFDKITDSMARSNKISSQVTAELLIKDKENTHFRSKKELFIIIGLIVIVLLLSILAFFRLRKKHTASVEIFNEEKTELNRKFENLQVDKLSEEVMQSIHVLAKTNDPGFYTKFKEHYPIFIYKLGQHSPDLLSSELDLCAKLKLGFNTKEIAYYGKSSQRSVESRKYRIRKKLGLGADDDLATWIINL